MGHNLYRMLRESEVFPTAGRGEQAVALIIADICQDTTRRPPPNMNASARVCEDLGIAPGTLGNLLAKLAARGLELRVPIGKDKRGRLVYAAKGHAVDFLFPLLPPRPPKGPRIDGPSDANAPQIDGPLDSEGPRIRGPLTPNGPHIGGALDAKGPRNWAQRSTDPWTPTPMTPKSKSEAPVPQGDDAPADDPMTQMIITELRTMTGVTVDAAAAGRIARELLARRAEPPARPVEWARTVLRAEPNLRRFLPTPIPPKFTAPPPAAPVRPESIAAAKAAALNHSRTPR